MRAHERRLVCGSTPTLHSRTRARAAAVGCGIDPRVIASDRGVSSRQRRHALQGDTKEGAIRRGCRQDGLKVLHGGAHLRAQDVTRVAFVPRAPQSSNPQRSIVFHVHHHHVDDIIVPHLLQVVVHKKRSECPTAFLDSDDDGKVVFGRDTNAHFTTHPHTHTSRSPVCALHGSGVHNPERATLAPKGNDLHVCVVFVLLRGGGDDERGAMALNAFPRIHLRPNHRHDGRVVLLAVVAANGGMCLIDEPLKRTIDEEGGPLLRGLCRHAALHFCLYVTAPVCVYQDVFLVGTHTHTKRLQCVYQPRKRILCVCVPTKECYYAQRTLQCTQTWTHASEW